MGGSCVEFREFGWRCFHLNNFELLVASGGRVVWLRQSNATTMSW